MAMIVDGKGLVAGRLASKVAKAAIKGENVTVVNAEQIVMVGNKDSIIAKFKTRTQARVLSNPHYGPKYSRIPSKIFRRSVRGMLPNKNTTAERLLKRIEVFNAVPKELANEKMQTFDDIKYNERHKAMTLKEIASLLGGKW